MEASPSYFDPQDLSIREQFRRYGLKAFPFFPNLAFAKLMNYLRPELNEFLLCRKRNSASSLSPQHDGSASRLSEIRSNAALFLEDIKQEVESLDMDHGVTPSKGQTSSKRRALIDGQGPSELGFGSGIQSLKALKQEEDGLFDGGDTTFSLFASLLDSAMQGAWHFFLEYSNEFFPHVMVSRYTPCF